MEPMTSRHQYHCARKQYPRKLATESRERVCVCATDRVPLKRERESATDRVPLMSHSDGHTDRVPLKTWFGRAVAPHPIQGLSIYEKNTGLFLLHTQSHPPEHPIHLPSQSIFGLNSTVNVWVELMDVVVSSGVDITPVCRIAFVSGKVYRRNWSEVWPSKTLFT